MKTNKRVKRKKFEWSKFITTLVCIICTIISVWCIYTYFELCKLAIMYNSMSMPDATLPVTSITALLGSILSYLIYHLNQPLFSNSSILLFHLFSIQLLHFSK